MSSRFRSDSWKDRYEVKEELGSGHYAIVKKCVENETGKEYAAKIISKPRWDKPSPNFSMSDIEREVQVLRQLQHENVVSLHEVYENKREVVLILELVSGGELFGHLCRHEKLSEEDAVGFLKQILYGVKHVHEHNIAHLDLKPENVLLLNAETHNLKLIDFGLAREISDRSPIRAMVGTPEFIAPEVVNFDPIGMPTDMWAIGVMTYILLSGSSPFVGASKADTYQHIISVDYTFPDKQFCGISDLAKDFIGTLLVKDPVKRGKVLDCLNHPWINPIRQNDVSLRRRSLINLDNLKRYNARRRWRQSFRVVALVNRLSRAAVSKSPSPVRLNNNDVVTNGDPLTAISDVDDS